MVSESTGPQAGPAVDVASCVIRVSNLDQSLKFYCDVSRAACSSMSPIWHCC